MIENEQTTLFTQQQQMLWISLLREINQEKGRSNSVNIISIV